MAALAGASPEGRAWDGGMGKGQELGFRRINQCPAPVLFGLEAPVRKSLHGGKGADGICCSENPFFKDCQEGGFNSCL